MSFELWGKLPDQFLRMKFPRWLKQSREVQELIVDLAKKQKFKCAICNVRTRKLVVDHDHDPEEGPSDSYTIYNIRGLVCQGCNWDLGFYEKETRGEAFGWGNVDCKLSEQDYERYIYAYECRTGGLREASLEKRLPNYWHRRIVLERFDIWYYEGGKEPRWYQKYKAERRKIIETPEDAVEHLAAIFQFVTDQWKANPNYKPPKEFWDLFIRIRPLLEKALNEQANAHSNM